VRRPRLQDAPDALRVAAQQGVQRAVLPDLPALSEAERALMAEWLDRAIGA
jgi:hypothetical protein